MPPSATLIQVADQIDQVIASGTHSQRKALIEALVAQVKIIGPGRIVPVFRIPQPTDTEHSEASKVSGVRAMTNLVGRTHHDANHDLVIAGDLLPVRLLNPRD